jgi:hypothetical protein
VVAQRARRRDSPLLIAEIPRERFRCSDIPQLPSANLTMSHDQNKKLQFGGIQEKASFLVLLVRSKKFSKDCPVQKGIIFEEFP